MQHERDKANECNHSEISVRTVAEQHAADTEQSRRKRRADHHIQRVCHGAWQAQIKDVEHRAQHDADHQRIVQHGVQNRAHGPDSGFAFGAHDLHRGDAQPIAKRRMHREDRIVGLKRVGPVGAFGDRKAQQNRVGKEAGKGDGDAVLPIALEHIARHQHAQSKPCGRAGVKADQKFWVKAVADIQRPDRFEQQAGNGEVLCELHQPVDRIVAEPTAPDGQIPRADHQKDGEDNF